MAGLATVTHDWAIVTKADIQTGIKYNNNFVIGSGEPQYFIGDKSIIVKKTNQNIKNCTQILAALLKSDDSLTITTYRSTGDEKYTVGKAADIKYCARYIKSNIITVTNDYTATLDDSVSDKVGKYDNRFIVNNAAFNLNDQLICRITKDGFTYLRAFDISGSTITLKDIVTGANSGVSGLSVGDTWELINAYNVMQESLEATTGYPVQGYVKKHVKPGEDTSYITFGYLDKPVKAYSENGEKVVIAYNELEDYNQRFIYNDSIERYGIFTHKEDLTAPVTYTQLSYIESTLRKSSQPQTIIELQTFRPTRPLKGWPINFDIPGLVEGIFKITDVSETFIDFNGGVICPKRRKVPFGKNIDLIC